MERSLGSPDKLPQDNDGPQSQVQKWQVHKFPVATC